MPPIIWTVIAQLALKLIEFWLKRQNPDDGCSKKITAFYAKHEGILAKFKQIHDAEMAKQKKNDAQG